MTDKSYIARGASATKDDVHAAIKSHDAGLYPGAFCKITPDVAGDPDFCSVMHADGAGTKSILAYLHYKETGDARAFRSIAQDSAVMNLDDVMCVGAVDNFIVSNTIGRNAHRIDADALKHLIGGYHDFQQTMAASGVTIELAGGETADLGDLIGTVVVDSTVLTRLPRNQIIDAGNIQPGNVIVGLASYGQATYESTYNSGIAANGFTAARHDLLSKYYADKYPETFSTTLEDDQVYCGNYKLSDTLPGSQQTIGEALLSPTRTYLPVVKAILSEHPTGITGIIHSSGGGQVKCRNFGHGLHYIKDNLFTPPPIFAAIQAASGAGTKDMYQTFNMGQRLEIFCDEELAAKIIAIAAKFHVEAQIIGRVEPSANPAVNQVTIKTGGETYEY